MSIFKRVVFINVNFLIYILYACQQSTYSEQESLQQRIITPSHPPGYYASDIQLSFLQGNKEGTIRFTVNGDHPHSESMAYSEPIYLSELTVDNNLARKVVQVNEKRNQLLNYLPNAVSIKAAIFDTSGNQLSDNFVFDYILEDHQNLPVFNINIPQESLLDKDTGIFVPGIHFDTLDTLWSGNYYQRGKKWERKAHVSYINPSKNKSFRQWVGLRTHGGNSRRFDQKGMRIIARKGLEEKRIKEQLFTHDSDIKRFTLKPFKASWSGYGFENLLGYRLARHLDVDCLEIHPVVVYINGVYWGIYLLEERMDKHYFKWLSGNENVRFDWARSDRILKSADSFEKSMDLDHFKSTLTEINDENYADLEQLIDISSYIDYQILEQFIGNFDWPANNNKRWREAGGKWRWIYFDGDAAFGDPFYNSMYHAVGVYNDRFYSVDENSTVLFQKLCAYPPFYDRFESRMNELLQTVLSSQFVQAEMDSIVIPESEVLRQVYRFAYPESIESWHKTVENVKNFIAQRPEAMKSFYADIEATLSSLHNPE